MACNPNQVITTSDMENLKENITYHKTVVESNLDTAETPDGQVRDTLTGRLKKLGYVPPVVYAAGITFTLPDDKVKTIERNGVIYAPLPSQIPFTTSGTWTGDDENKFFVVQGVTTSTLPTLTDLVFDSVADMKGGANISIAALPILAETKSYLKGTASLNLTGGAQYTIASISYIRDAIGDPSWVPDGYGDHYITGLGDGTTYVAFCKSPSAKRWGAKGQVDPVTFVGDDESVIFNALTARCKLSNINPLVESGYYKVSEVNIEGSTILYGEGENLTFFIPAAAGNMFNVKDNYSGIQRCSGLHDRSFGADFVNIIPTIGSGQPNSINRWQEIKNLHLTKIKGAAIKCLNSLWELEFSGIQARSCGDASRSIANYHIQSNDANNDAPNNITFRNCYAIFPQYIGFYIAGTENNKVRKIRLLGNMAHGGTDENDLTTAPYPLCQITDFEVSWLNTNNFTVGNDTVPIVLINGSSGNKSKLVNLSDNTIESESNNGIGLRIGDTVDINLQTNNFSELATGTHIDILSSCNRTSIERQLVKGGVTPVINNAAVERTGYINGEQIFFDNARLDTPNINNAKNFSFNVAVSNESTLSVVLPTPEADNTYLVTLQPNFNHGGAYFSNKSSTGFDINFPTTGSGFCTVIISREDT